MAGTLEITQELCWMPAGWVFDRMLERMAAELTAREPDLASSLLAATTEQNGGYLDIRGFDDAAIRKLLKAADHACRAFEREGPAAWQGPEFHAGFMVQIRALRDMLKARSREGAHSQQVA
jgi:hypothetical protein